MTQIAVLGGGMVGVGAALALRDRGHDVIVVDRSAPGSETSYGNAGLIQAEAMEPYAMPRDLPTLWGYAIGTSNRLSYSVSDLPGIAMPLWRYFQASSSQRHRKISAAYSKIIARATSDHAPLIAAAGVDHLIRRDGFYRLFRDGPAFDAAIAKARRLESEYAVSSRVLDEPLFREEEPALLGRIAGAIQWTDSWATSDPGKLTQAYASLLQSRGGAVVTGDADTLTPMKNGWLLETAGGKIDVSDVVISLGPWSSDFLMRFGYQIPMLLKRGYHSHFRMPAPLRRPVLDDANGIMLASMIGGLRITTGAQLVRQSAPANPHQLRRGVIEARKLFDIGEEVGEAPWIGHRPCMPDMLPVVGRAPRHRGLWFNFGHGHQGLTLGPTTGVLLADLFEGGKGDVLDALSPSRLVRQ